jgi:hypothetical protein
VLREEVGEARLAREVAKRGQELRQALAGPSLIELLGPWIQRHAQLEVLEAVEVHGQPRHRVEPHPALGALLARDADRGVLRERLEPLVDLPGVGRVGRVHPVLPCVRDPEHGHQQLDARIAVHGDRDLLGRREQEREREQEWQHDGIQSFEVEPRIIRGDSTLEMGGKGSGAPTRIIARAAEARREVEDLRRHSSLLRVQLELVDQHLPGPHHDLLVLLVEPELGLLHDEVVVVVVGDDPQRIVHRHRAHDLPVVVEEDEAVRIGRDEVAPVPLETEEPIRDRRDDLLDRAGGRIDLGGSSCRARARTACRRARRRRRSRTRDSSCSPP